MKKFADLLNEAKLKTPQFYKNESGDIAHLSGTNKTSKFSFRVRGGKRMEFEDQDTLEKFMHNNKWTKMNADATVFNKFFRAEK